MVHAAWHASTFLKHTTNMRESVQYSRCINNYRIFAPSACMSSSKHRNPRNIRCQKSAFCGECVLRKQLGKRRRWILMVLTRHLSVRRARCAPGAPLAPVRRASDAPTRPVRTSRHLVRHTRGLGAPGPRSRARWRSRAHPLALARPSRRPSGGRLPTSQGIGGSRWCSGRRASSSRTMPTS